MQTMQPEEFLLLVIGTFFAIGLFTFAAGLFILLARALGRETRTLAKQSARLANKGLTDDIAGLVGNVSALISATNQLVRTAAGIGIFLTILGLGIMAIAVWLAINFGLWA
ncbi:MAG: hypothetical protein OEV06_05280 [Anaerolineae bacterium]|nr:hypothetical protein [Anaerolineae bacterium]